MVSEKQKQLKLALMRARIKHEEKVEARQLKKVEKHSKQFNDAVDKMHEAIDKFEGKESEEKATEEVPAEKKPNKIKDAIEAAKEEISYAFTTFGIGQAALYEQGKAYIDAKKNAKKESEEAVPRVEEGRGAQTLPPKKKSIFTVVPDEKPAKKAEPKKQQNNNKKPTNNKASNKKK